MADNQAMSKFTLALIAVALAVGVTAPAEAAKKPHVGSSQVYKAKKKTKQQKAKWGAKRNKRATAA
jgi:hypothetical protein